MSAHLRIAELGGAELALLDGACLALEVDEVAGQSMLLHVADGQHEWFVQTPLGQLHIATLGKPSSADDLWVGVSERVRRFANTVGAETMSLLLADDMTVVATDGVLSAAVDAVPYAGDVPPQHEVHTLARVSVPLQQFAALLDSARSLPAGVDSGLWPMPPVWLHLGGGTLGLHVDWNDYLPNRASYRVDVSHHQGEATLAIPHVHVDTFVRALLRADWSPDDELTIELGWVNRPDGEREVVALQGAWWRMLLWLEDPLEWRWGSRIDEVFAKAGDLRVIDRDIAEWIVADAAHQVRVMLHAGHPDLARMSLPLLQHVDPSFELLTELSQLNASSDGVRFWCGDRVVWAAADVPCSDLSSLPRMVRKVLDARARFGPLLAVFGEGEGDQSGTLPL
jgi:hypothetical protein